MSAQEWAGPMGGFEDHLLLSGRAVTTVAGYLQHLRWLSESVSPGPWELTSSELAAWLDARGWSRETRRKVLVTLRSFYAWAVSERLIEWAPTAGLPSAERRKPGPSKRRLPGAWEEPIEAFVAWGRAGARGEGTLALRLFWLGRLSEVASDPWTVTTVQLAQWLSNPDWAAETKRSGRASVRVFYGWAVKTGRLESSPAEDLDSVLLPRALPRPAPDGAIREGLAGADDRVRLIIQLAAFAGLRRAEIAGLHCNQIGEQELLVVGKAGHHRRVPLHPDLGDSLRAEMARRRDGRHGSGWSGPYVSATGYLFPSDKDPGPISADHLGRLVSQALPEDWSAHNLRHRFGTTAYSVQRDLRAVQELLGHAKPETTARYAAVPDGAKLTAVHGVGLGW